MRSPPLLSIRSLLRSCAWRSPGVRLAFAPAASSCCARGLTAAACVCITIRCLLQGGDADAHKFRPNGQISGSLDSLPQASYLSSGNAMLVQFTSDETAPEVGEGFEAYYDCV